MTRALKHRILWKAGAAAAAITLAAVPLGAQAPELAMLDTLAKGAWDLRIRDDGTLDCADGEYDLVASFQVLEHVWDLDAYLGEARRALRPEGWLLLSTHGS